MPNVTVNGFDVNYREAGEGFPIVLIHGFTGNLRNWALTVPALRERFHTVSVDLRGHGHSAKPERREDYTFEGMAADVYGLMRHLDIDEAVVAGHSMGGMVAQHLALEHPEAVRALVLVDTAAEVPDSPLFRRQRADRERLIEIARTGDMGAVFDERLKMTPLPPQARDNPEFIRLWREQFVLTSPDAYIHCADGLRSSRPVLQELPNIKVPTLIVCGENDEPFLEPSQKMHAAIAGSELVIIPGAGHGPQMETPAEFNRVLTGFLSRVQETVTA